MERERERLSGKHGNARVHAASLASPALCLHFLSERESQWCENRSIEGGAGGGQRARGFLTGSRVTSNRDLDLDRSRSRFDVVGVGQLLSARSRLAKAFFFLLTLSSCPVLFAWKKGIACTARRALSVAGARARETCSGESASVPRRDEREVDARTTKSFVVVVDARESFDGKKRLAKRAA